MEKPGRSPIFKLKYLKSSGKRFSIWCAIKFTISVILWD